MNIVEASGLGKRYGSTWALRECTLAVPAGHVTVLVGPNGAGKTTLLNIAVGLAAPSAGSVTVLGGRAARSPAALDGIAFVAQDTPLYKNLSVADMVYLTSRTGSATRVASVRGEQTDGQPQGRPAGMAPATPEAATGTTGTTGRAGSADAATPPLIADFRPGVPDLSRFPRTDWAWAVKQACTRAADADLGYGDPRGNAELREVLAGYLRRVRAADAHPGRMIISTGFAQGVNLVLRALARPGGVTRVALEDPGYGRAQDDETVRAVLAMGIGVSYVPVDQEGLLVSELAASGAQAVVVTPAHQSPTGVVLSPARRQALTDWARRCGGYVIEDDYDSEFRYDKEPVDALQGLAPDQVFLLGTASKALAPAVRLGWVHAPAALAAAVAAEKEMSDRGSCTIDQLALATLLTTGRYDRHLRRMRAVYAARRAALPQQP